MRSKSASFQRPSIFCARIVLTALLLVIAPQGAQAVSLNAIVNASVPSGTGCNFTTVGSAATGACSDSIGTSSVSAFAQPGHIGGMANATSFDPFNSLQAIGTGTASYFDTVIFTSKNPLDTNVTVSMNVIVSGVVDSTSSGNASALLTMFVQSLVGDFRISSNNGSAPACSVNFGSSSCNSGLGGVPFSLDLVLTTLPIQVALNTPISFGLGLDVTGIGTNGGFASV